MINKKGLIEGRLRYGPLTNAGRDMGEYAKCASCSHEKALHTEGNGTCYSCGCADFKNALKNDVRYCPECEKEFTDGASLIGHLIISHEYDHTKAVKRVDSMENDKDITALERELAIGKPIPSRAGDDAIENAPIRKTGMKEDFKCPKCGDSGRLMVDLERGICVDCAEKLENAGGFKEIKSAVDCAECGKQTTYISTEPLLDGLNVCAPCFKKAIKGMENAQGKLIVAGGESKEVAFVECQTCGEGINESRIQEHLGDGHTVEKVMKVLKNDAKLGFQYATSTTTDVFDLDNTMCDICRKETGAALEEHLVTRHGLEVEVAGVVARDIEDRQA